MTKIMIMRLTCQKELRKSLGLVVLFIGTAMVPTVSYAQFGSLKGLGPSQESQGKSSEDRRQFDRKHQRRNRRRIISHARYRPLAHAK